MSSQEGGPKTKEAKRRKAKPKSQKRNIFRFLNFNFAFYFSESETRCRREMNPLPDSLLSFPKPRGKSKPTVFLPFDIERQINSPIFVFFPAAFSNLPLGKRGKIFCCLSSSRRSRLQRKGIKPMRAPPLSPILAPCVFALFFLEHRRIVS